MSRHSVCTHEPTSEFNSGRWLAHPIESSYGRARRLMVANPVAGLPAINRRFSAWGPNLIPEGLEARLPRNGIACRQPRQCAECARHLFHPTIYQVPGLRRCPIHHQAFTSRCPQCGQPWQRPLRERWPRCERCGIPSWRDLATLSLPQRAYRHLGWLERWTRQTVLARDVHPRVELIDLRALTDWVGTMERPRFESPTLSHPFYLAFEAAKSGRDRMARLAKLEVITVATPSRRRTTELRPWTPEVGRTPIHRKDPNASIPANSRSLIQLAIRRLLRWQAKTLRHPHALTWRDYSRLRPDEYLEDGHLCPVCWAFSLWLPALLLKFAHPVTQPLKGAATTHETCRYTGYDHFPLTPEAVAVKQPGEQWYRPSTSFERWLYLRSCDYLFVELLFLANWLRQRLRYKPTHYSLTIYHSSHRFTVPALASQLLDLEPRANYRHLAATYLYASPLDELSHSNEVNVENVHCVSQRDADAPLIWQLPEGTSRLGADDISHLFDELVPRFKALSNGYSWASDSWCSWSERAVTDIDCRACKITLPESPNQHCSQ